MSTKGVLAEKVQPWAGLSHSQLEQIKQLEEQCNQHERLTMKLNWSRLQNRPTDQINDFLYYHKEQLVGYLALYGFQPKEVEVSAMTHPNYRQHGIFAQLLTHARSELTQRQTPDFLFICEEISQSGKACLAAITAKYDFSEYRMDLQTAVLAVDHATLQMRLATIDDVDLIAQLDTICFDIALAQTQSLAQERLANPHRYVWIASVKGQIIGKIQGFIITDDIYISGFCLFPEYRGQGYGPAMLTQTVSHFTQQGYGNISLEVATNNRNALSLYEQCGFAVITGYDYYRLSVSGN